MKKPFVFLFVFLTGPSWALSVYTHSATRNGDSLEVVYEIRRDGGTTISAQLTRTFRAPTVNDVKAALFRDAHDFDAATSRAAELQGYVGNNKPIPDSSGVFDVLEIVALPDSPAVQITYQVKASAGGAVVYGPAAAQFSPATDLTQTRVIQAVQNLAERIDRAAATRATLQAGAVGQEVEVE